MCLLQVRDLWEEYYSGADAIVFMVDSGDHERFEEVRDGWFRIAVFLWCDCFSVARVRLTSFFQLPQRTFLDFIV
jgi:GTPase SAR1 family protein